MSAAQATAYKRVPSVKSKGRVAAMPDTEGEEKLRQLHLRVGLPGGTVHEFQLAPNAKLQDVADAVRQAENLPTTSRVRLISAGRLCDDHSVLVSNITGQNSFLHAAISDAVEPTEEPELEEDGEIGETLVLEAFEAGGEVRVIIPNFSSRSIDRLIQAGLREEEIRLWRRQVRIMRREVRERGAFADLEEPLEREGGEQQVRTRRLDESRFLLSSGIEGSNGDFLMGCILGYLLGVIVLVLLLDNSATRRWRVGLIAGVATNCAFGILRTSLSLQESFPAP